LSRAKQTNSNSQMGNSSRLDFSKPLKAIGRGAVSQVLLKLCFGTNSERTCKLMTIRMLRGKTMDRMDGFYWTVTFTLAP